MLPPLKPLAIEPVARAFAVLETLARRRLTTMSDLENLTRLPRPTLTRMLHSLMALGYVMRVSRDQGYRVTDKVLGLSAGLRFVDRVVDAAIGPMDRFTQTSGWPLALGILSDGAVVVRYSTIPISPFSLKSSNYGVRFSVLEAALGRAHLAYCSRAERQDILTELASARGVSAPEAFWRAMLREPVKVEQELRTVRLLGFAGTRSSRAGRVSGIAVPILVGGRPVGAISMRYPRSAMTEEKAAGEYVPQLQSMARAIADIVTRPRRL